MMINRNYPTCPICGEELTPISRYDVEDIGTNTLAVSVLGMCDCGKQYEWVEYYTYKGHVDIQPTEIKAREK